VYLIFFVVFQGKRRGEVLRRGLGAWSSSSCFLAPWLCYRRQLSSVCSSVGFCLLKLVRKPRISFPCQKNVSVEKVFRVALVCLLQVIRFNIYPVVLETQATGSRDAFLSLLFRVPRRAHHFGTSARVLPRDPPAPLSAMFQFLGQRCKNCQNWQRP